LSAVIDGIPGPYWLSRSIRVSLDRANFRWSAAAAAPIVRSFRGGAAGCRLHGSGRL
jgi:hypothetical protein